jgi:hypothetical protein
MKLKPLIPSRWQRLCRIVRQLWTRWEAQVELRETWNARLADDQKPVSLTLIDHWRLYEPVNNDFRIERADVGNICQAVAAATTGIEIEKPTSLGGLQATQSFIIPNGARFAVYMALRPYWRKEDGG